MKTSIHNAYLFKALDAYPFELEETMEALNYALSYNDKDAHALYFMGRVYAEQLQDYEAAKHYYAEALAQRMEMHQVYPHYVRVLLWNGDFEAAQKLLNYAFTVRGVDKAALHLLQGQRFEGMEQLKEAIAAYKKAKATGLNNSFIDFVNGELSRVKKKMKPEKKKKKNKPRA